MSPIRKFASLENLAGNAANAFKRFPLALLCALLTTVALVIITGSAGKELPHGMQRLAMACGLGVPFFILLVTAAEKWNLNRKKIWLLQIFGIVLIVLYYISLPQNPFINYSHIVRFLLLLISLHFAVAFLPYLGGNQVEGFWQYNKSLFLQFLNSALFSAVMFIGLALALVAAKELFGFNIPERRFLQLFMIMAIGFNTWIFLARIPADLDGLNDITNYPNGLRIFAQYILLPLIGLYFVILYAYEIKIIIAWTWPKGWVSQLVLWFSVAGILSLLLLWPLRNMTENRWIKTFTKWFFRALIPLIIMLFLAIFERVGDYGITINRYLVIAMAVGLTILVLYFVFAKAKDIRIIPIILCFLALFSAYGPWSAFAVSRHSQQSRLENYLHTNRISISSTPSTLRDDIPLNDRREMSNIISYLAEWHGLKSFSPWLSASKIDFLKTSAGKYYLPDSLALAFGFKFEPGPRIMPEEGIYFVYNKKDSTGVEIAGYDRLLNYNIREDPNIEPKTTYYVDGDSIQVWKDGHNPSIKIRVNSLGETGIFPLTDSLRPAVGAMVRNEIDGQRLNFETVLGNYDTRLHIEYISGVAFPDSINVKSMNSYILLRKNK